MATINQLTAASSLSLSDLLAVYSSGNGDARKASLSLLLEFLQEQMTAAGGLVSQYAAPNATGFSVTVAPPTSGGSVWLLITPTAGFAAGALVLPTTATHGQEVLVSCTQSVATLTVSGGTVNGAPSALSANGFFRLRYDGVLASWFRIG